MQKTIYSTGLVCVFTVLTLPVLITAGVLWLTGEMWPGSWIASYQLRNQTLYSAGFNQRDESYKKGLMEAIRPEIAVLGTSRALQARQDMFDSSFVNLGRAIEMHELPNSYISLTDTFTPREIIWFVDYWIFANSNCETQKAYRAVEEHVAPTAGGESSIEITPQFLFGVWRRAWMGRASALDLALAILGMSEHNGSRLGLRAMLSDEGGYTSDGSYLHGFGTLTWGVPNQTVYLLAADERVCPRAVTAFRETLDYMKKQKVQVSLVLPPLAKAYAKVLVENSKFASYWEETLAIIENEASGRSLPFTNEIGISYPDQEFLDSEHPGEVILSKIFLKLVRQQKEFGSKFDVARLQKIVRSCQGMSTCPERFTSFLKAR